MSVNRLERIRSKEKQYHDDCYENSILFQHGSWLHKPVKTILDLFEGLDEKNDLRILDLGCGVGRNSIPLAQRLTNAGGKVVCVDLLQSAIRNLENYGKQYEVIDRIETVISDISDFNILPNSYDYLFSVSALEHLDSKVTFDRVLTKMIEGTREQGIHCLIINSNISETVIGTGAQIDPMFELLFDTDELVSKLQMLYKNWRVLKQTVKGYEIEIIRDGKEVLLKSDVVTWAVQDSRRCN
ncbi:class I SAM-dependent methyltransferase [Paenibacillus sp. GCM10023248]|uniref:class I SAM-dependent methyltransferase n=1 Tax=Bacillales TaxID=1385 RepID=UPI00285F1037|nr:2-polyprenyl-3-methyl-5-hydroxy-6-metoxy-1,4-benzoquinol methylase [Bacillus sp. 3255]